MDRESVASSEPRVCPWWLIHTFDNPVRRLFQKPEKIQLESMKKEGAKLGIEGIALDDETIANFMTNLRKSRLFKNIDLIVSEQSEQSRIKLKKFTLSCEISFM